MNDKEYIYDGPLFGEVPISPETYKPEYFQKAIELESEVFYQLRITNNIVPHKLSGSSPEELEKISRYFEKNAGTFYFLFVDGGLAGTILHEKNYIRSLAVARNYQRRGFGELLVKYTVNAILTLGYTEIRLHVLDGNTPAERLYSKLGFRQTG